jgi:hypothetical protein
MRYSEYATMVGGFPSGIRQLPGLLPSGARGAQMVNSPAINDPAPLRVGMQGLHGMAWMDTGHMDTDDSSWYR